MPRGISKEKADLDEWLKEVAPSDELRSWFDHDPDKWKEFKRRYAQELEPKSGELQQLIEQAGRQPLILLYAARDQEHNNARALKMWMESSLYLL